MTPQPFSSIWLDIGLFKVAHDFSHLLHIFVSTPSSLRNTESFGPIDRDASSFFSERDYSLGGRGVSDTMRDFRQCVHGTLQKTRAQIICIVDHALHSVLGKEEGSDVHADNNQIAAVSGYGNPSQDP